MSIRKGANTVNYALSSLGLGCLLGLHRQLNAMPELIISTWKTYTISRKRAYIFSTWMQTTFTDGQGSRSTNTWIFMEGCRQLYPRRNRWTCQKRQEGIYVEYPKGLHENHNELPFLAERMKIQREKRLVPNLEDKKGYVVHIKPWPKIKKGTPGY